MKNCHFLMNFGISGVFSKISCPKFLKSSSAIQIKFRANYEISDNLAALMPYLIQATSNSIFKGICKLTQQISFGVLF